MRYPRWSDCWCLLGNWLLKPQSHRQQTVAREKWVHPHSFWQKSPCSRFGCQQIAAVICSLHRTHWPIYKYSISSLWMVVKLKNLHKMEREHRVVEYVFMNHVGCKLKLSATSLHFFKFCYCLANSWHRHHLCELQTTVAMRFLVQQPLCGQFQLEIVCNF